jgi:hypothetical protein
MLAPLAVARSLVVDAREEVELVQRYLLLLDTELMLQLPLCGVLHAKNRFW